MNKRCLLLVFIYSITSYNSAYSAVHPICDDLYAAVCSPGKIKDRTGIGFNADSRTFISEVSKSYSKQMKTALFNEIKEKPAAGKLFMSNAIHGFGLKSRDICIRAENESDYSKECKDLVVKTTSTLGHSFLFQKVVGGVNGPTFISRSLIIHSPVFQGMIKKIRTEIEKEFVDKDKQEKIRKILVKVKRILKSKIDLYVKDKKWNERMKLKVDAVELNNSVSCLGWNDNRKNEMSELFVSNASLNHEHRELSICPGMFLTNTSNYNLVETIAHEVGHSVGPCGMTIDTGDYSTHTKEGLPLSEADDKYPLPELIRCLRSKRSINAKTIKQFKNSQKHNQSSPDDHNSRVFKKANNVAKGPKHVGYCSNKDEITESVPDWWGIEVLGTYIEEGICDDSSDCRDMTAAEHRKGISNVSRGTCNNLPYILEVRERFDSHPAKRRRVNKILLVNPKIRALMGCGDSKPKDADYCNPIVEELNQSRKDINEEHVK